MSTATLRPALHQPRPTMHEHRTALHEHRPAPDERRSHRDVTGRGVVGRDVTDRRVPARRPAAGYETFEPRPRGLRTHPRDGRPTPESVIGSPRVAGTRCGEPAGARVSARNRAARRRSWVLATVAGAILAFSVWTLAIVGGNYADSVTPAPVRTEVTHVRAGDSLSTIAQRVAPDLPRQTVIDQIIELNGMGSSGLRVGQPLLTPAYH